MTRKRSTFLVILCFVGMLFYVDTYNGHVGEDDDNDFNWIVYQDMIPLDKEDFFTKENESSSIDYAAGENKIADGSCVSEDLLLCGSRNLNVTSQNDTAQKQGEEEFLVSYPIYSNTTNSTLQEEVTTTTSLDEEQSTRYEIPLLKTTLIKTSTDQEQSTRYETSPAPTTTTIKPSITYKVPFAATTRHSIQSSTDKEQNTKYEVLHAPATMIFSTDIEESTSTTSTDKESNTKYEVLLAPTSTNEEQTINYDVPHASTTSSDCSTKKQPHIKVPPVQYPHDDVATLKHSCLLFRYNKPACSCVIIKSQFALTTCNNCLKGKGEEYVPEDFLIKYVYTTYPKQVQVNSASVQEIMPHPDCFDKRDIYNSDYNIGLVQFQIEKIFGGAKMHYAFLPPVLTYKWYYDNYAHLSNLEIENEDCRTPFWHILTKVINNKICKLVNGRDSSNENHYCVVYEHEKERHRFRFGFAGGQ